MNLQELLNKVTTPRFEKTPLRPVQNQGPALTTGPMQFKATLQIHKSSANIVKFSYHLSANGTLVPLMILLGNLSRSTASNLSQANRPIFISSSCDPRTYTTRQGQTRHGDSNRQMLKEILCPNSPWNSYIVSGTASVLNVPAEASTWDNEKYNAHFFKLQERLQELENLQTDEKSKAEAYEAAWNQYMKVENLLLEKSVTIKQTVLVTDQSGVVPSLTLSQTATYRSPKLTGRAIIAAEDSQVSFIPLINSVSGVFQLSDATVDAGGYEFGLRNAQQTEGERSIKTYSTEIIAHDFANRPMSLPMSLALSDLPYATNRSRAESFQEFCQENSYVRLENAQLMLRFTDHGLGSYWHLYGDNTSYFRHVLPGVEAYSLDDEVLGDLADLVETQADDALVDLSDEF